MRHRPDVSSPRPIAIVQARLGSSRLPRKVLEPIEGRPMIAHVVERLRRSRELADVVLAIPEGDDELAIEAERLGVPVRRGPEHDVLARYVAAAESTGADPVVRITSDCPLIDPDLVDRVVERYRERRRHGVDLVANTSPRRWPRGLDTEVVRLGALERLAKIETDPAIREHVTLGLRRRPETFRVEGLEAERDLSEHRWTVDTADDLAFVRAVYGELRDTPAFGTEDVLALLARRPDIRALNAHVAQKELPPGGAS
jgi:spore coat polysaccharide biosynthesis protein SpsF